MEDARSGDLDEGVARMQIIDAAMRLKGPNVLLSAYDPELAAQQATLPRVIHSLIASSARRRFRL